MKLSTNDLTLLKVDGGDNDTFSTPYYNDNISLTITGRIASTSPKIINTTRHKVIR